MNEMANRVTLLILCVLSFSSCTQETKTDQKPTRIERKKLRDDYFFNKLKDPTTYTIPENVRAKEMMFSSRLKASASQKRTTTDTSNDLEWNEIGPADIGGRTRALSQDITDGDVILAGGVSGGIWKSTDGGATWDQKLPDGSHLSITSIAQDPNNTNVWYATTGETSGNSAGAQGAYYYGSGIYKSQDGGDSWILMTYERSSGDDDTYLKQTSAETRISSLLQHPFQLTSKVLAVDIEGESVVIITTQYWGIWSSTDGGDTFYQFASFLINDEDPVYSDIVVDDHGVITVWFGPTNSGDNGFYRSYDYGESFWDVTPDDYPSTSDNARVVLSEYPSGDFVYAFIYDGTAWGGSSHLFQFDFSELNNEGGSFGWNNNSENLPNFSESIFGGTEDFTTQGGYDMTLAVSPTDPNFVVLGYVNLIKSEDGFSTSPTTDPAKSWIGGNENPWRLDEQLDFGSTHHADQHIVFFDHFNSNILWSGHDGGVSVTQDITADRVSWESLNNDYNVTQYYSVSAGYVDGDSYVIGGTQDNGTPLLEHYDFINGNLLESLGDLSSGDGAYCYAGRRFVYASAQEGWIVPSDLMSGAIGWESNGFIKREDLSTFFIHPFAIDPNDEGTLFFATNGDGVLPRNTQFDEGLTNADFSLIENGWEDFALGNSVQITALAVSDQNPSHLLYFGGTLDGDPVLYGWANANTDPDNNISGRYLTEISESELWLNDIAVNPRNGSELILVYSNYNITGLYHSTDGGDSFVAIEGNLGSNDDLGGQGFTGPSLRAAEIAEDSQGNKKYYVATSIGLYSTTTLNGASTVWSLETTQLDNIVIEDLDYRVEDGALAVGTHGRGIFMGTTPKTDIVWDGTTWSNITGPTAQDNVIIAGKLISDQSPSINDLIINQGDTLFITSSNTLTVNGDLQVNGGLIIESGASLITFDQNEFNGDVTIKRNTRYADGKYSFVGTPVEQSEDMFGDDLGSYVYKYNEGTPYGSAGLLRWEGALADQLIPGSGYTQAFQKELIFTGKPNAGTIIYSGTYTQDVQDSYEGWNLVANPYPAAISFTEFMNDNTNNTGAIYIWDDHGSDQGRGTNSDYIVINASGSTDSNSGNLNRYDGHIASSQGYFIQLDGLGDNDVVFEEDQRVVGNNQDDHFFRKYQDIPRVHIKLVNDSGLERKTLVTWNEEVNDNEINRLFDAPLFNEGADFSLFTLKLDQPLAIHTLTPEVKNISLGMNIPDEGTYTFHFDLGEYNNELLLKDNLSGEIHDLSKNSYSFYSKAGSLRDRFELITAETILDLSVAKKWKTYTHGNVLKVESNQQNETGKLEVYSLSGKLVHRSVIDAKGSVALTGVRPGVYVVSIGGQVEKIVLK